MVSIDTGSNCVADEAPTLRNRALEGDYYVGFYGGTSPAAGQFKCIPQKRAWPFGATALKVHAQLFVPGRTIFTTIAPTMAAGNGTSSRHRRQPLSDLNVFLKGGPGRKNA